MPKQRRLSRCSAWAMSLLAKLKKRPRYKVFRLLKKKRKQFTKSPPNLKNNLFLVFEDYSIAEVSNLKPIFAYKKAHGAPSVYPNASMMKLKVHILSLIAPLMAMVLLSSCAEQYNIAGNASLPKLNGQMLYLQDNFAAERPRVMDSCLVVHGEFQFLGEVDTAMFVQLYVGNESVLPVVLESGTVKITVDNASQQVRGGKYNDRLYKFFRKREQLQNQLWELDQQYYSHLNRGTATKEVYNNLKKQGIKIMGKIDALETKFVMDNYDNPLGPGMFLMLGEAYPVPVMTEQLRRIYDSAPPSFKKNPRVARFVNHAQRFTFPL